MKRDILIFPKFKDIEKIQEIRDKYDPLAKAVPPHITIVFPFSDDIDNTTLTKNIREAIKGVKPFNICFSGLSLFYDKYYAHKNVIFLNCKKGKDEIINLHNTIYKNVLPTHLNSDVEYIPHITLGNADSLEDISLDDNFEYLVDELILEGISKDEESIILDRIKLDNSK